MTVPNTTNKNQYVGNDATTSFPYLYRIFNKTQLEVTKTTVAGVEVPLVVDIDYTVLGIGDPSGSITFPVSGSPLAAGELITIKRLLPITQETDLINQGEWNPQVVENALDRDTMVAQQQQDDIDRSIKTPISELTQIGNLGTVVQRAQTVLSFDDIGDPVTEDGSGANGRLVTVDDVLAASDFADAAEAFAIISEGFSVDSQNSATASQVSADDSAASAAAAQVAVKPQWISADTFGAANNIASLSGDLDITANGSGQITSIDAGSKTIKRWGFDFTLKTWIQSVGVNALGIGNEYAICSTTSIDTPLWNDSTKLIELYRFNGVNIVLVFAGISFPAAGQMDMTGLTGDSIAAVDASAETLQAFDHNGSAWATLGDEFDLSTISGLGDPEDIESMSATRVVIVGSSGIAIMDFDGDEWSLVGNVFSDGNNRRAVTVLNDTDFVYHRLDTNRVISVFRFDGTDIKEVSERLEIAGTASVDMAALNGRDLAFLDTTVKDLQSYRFDFYTGLGPYIQSLV